MNKKYSKLHFIITKILIFILQASHFIAIFLRKALAKKTILLVSKKQIKSYHISPFVQIFFTSLVVFIINVFINSIQYHSIIVQKSNEIKNLKEMSKEFSQQVEDLKSNLQEINNYFSTVASYKSENNQRKSEELINKKIDNLFSHSKIDQENKKIAAEIINSELTLDNIKNSTKKRIKELEQKLAITGIKIINDNKIILSSDNNDLQNDDQIISLNNEDLMTKQGGPFEEFKEKINSFSNSTIFKLFTGNGEEYNSSNGFGDDMQHLANLERFIHYAPLSPPMEKNQYYISSSFGKRIDPIKKIAAQHNGMDFVGGYKQEIVSPSAGKIIFAGKFSSYGNAIIIDHGYGITTRYGHLSKLYVRKGDYITKGQKIASQGSSGRSTGQHLHYEVRFKNIPLNPRKFLQAGREIFG